MKSLKSILIYVCLLMHFSVQAQIIIDHNDIDITSRTLTQIQLAKSNLHIVMGGTSHASQITTGLWELDDFVDGGGYGLSLPAGAYTVSFGDGSGNTLDYRHGAMNGTAGIYPTFYDETIRYYDHSITEGPRVNVFFWMFCAELSFDYDQQDVMDNYLLPMQQLEALYPDVTFIYSTGHLDGDAAGSQLHANNALIRQFCEDNNKILYDFADIEKYDPDGTYYGDRHPTDAGNYDYNNDGATSEDNGDPAHPINGDHNWAIDWANSHTEGVDWFDCEAAHTYPVNANMKACAAWNLFIEIAEFRAGSPINHPPVLTVPGSQTVNEEEVLSFTISATDPDAGDILTYSATNLPTNASFNPSTRTCTFSPDANQSGMYTVTFSVSDGALSDDEDVQITVLNTTGVNTPPVLTHIANQSTNEGQTLAFTVSATDADNDALTFSVRDNPTNSYLDATTQEFFFTPNYQQSGTYNVIFSVTDGQDTDSYTVQITVNDVNQQPVIGSLPDQIVHTGIELSFSIGVSDQDPSDNIVLNATGLPAEAQLVKTSTRIWTFSWTPNSSDVGTHEVTFTASDGSLTDSEAMVITVDDSDPNAITEPGRSNKIVSQNYPNPFSTSTTIAYQLPNKSKVRLEVFDMRGKKICVLINQKQEAGAYEVPFTTENSLLTEGIYLYKLTTDKSVLTKRMILSGR